MNTQITELAQSAVLRGTGRYIINPDNTLTAKLKKGGRYYEYTVNLVDLEPIPRQSRYFATSMFVTASIFFVFFALVVLGAIRAPPSSDSRLILAICSFVPGLAVFLCSVGAIRQSSSLTIFAHRTRENDSLVLLANKPSREAVALFAETLSARIAEVQKSKTSWPT